jgi:dTDP-4-dehydrorhamnose 3,5-epimerase
MDFQIRFLGFLPSHQKPMGVREWWQRYPDKFCFFFSFFPKRSLLICYKNLSMANIHGVLIEPLKKIPDDRGRIMHIMKSTDSVFEKFGEVYCSTVYPGVVKGWHIHERMTLNYVVLKGMIKFVLYDDREDSPTKGIIQEIYMGDHNYVRVTVPPKIWNGFMGLGNEEALVINVTDIPHDPNEIRRQDPHKGSINYSWAVKDR